MCVPRNECPFGGVQLLAPVAAFDPRMQCNSKEQSQAWLSFLLVSYWQFPLGNWDKKRKKKGVMLVAWEVGHIKKGVSTCSWICDRASDPNSNVERSKILSICIHNILFSPMGSIVQFLIRCSSDKFKWGWFVQNWIILPGGFWGFRELSIFSRIVHNHILACHVPCHRPTKRIKNTVWRRPNANLFIPDFPIFLSEYLIVTKQVWIWSRNKRTNLEESFEDAQ